MPRKSANGHDKTLGPTAAQAVADPPKLDPGALSKAQLQELKAHLLHAGWRLVQDDPQRPTKTPTAFAFECPNGHGEIGAFVGYDLGVRLAPNDRSDIIAVCGECETRLSVRRFSEAAAL